jgi:hypothetical protein
MICLLKRANTSHPMSNNLECNNDIGKVREKIYSKFKKINKYLT